MNNNENENVQIGCNIEDDYKVLNNVQGAIRNFDNKAGILVSVISIIFALSLHFISGIKELSELVEFNKDLVNNLNAFKTLYIIFGISGVFSIISCLLVFYPRKNKKKDNHLNVNYYLDLHKMKNDDYDRTMVLWKTERKFVKEQIKINAKICTEKHIFLKISIYSFILFVVLFFTLVCFNIFFLY